MKVTVLFIFVFTTEAFFVLLFLPTFGTCFFWFENQSEKYSVFVQDVYKNDGNDQDPGPFQKRFEQIRNLTRKDSHGNEEYFTDKVTYESVRIIDEMINLSKNICKIVPEEYFEIVKDLSAYTFSKYLQNSHSGNNDKEMSLLLAKNLFKRCTTFSLPRIDQIISLPNQIFHFDVSKNYKDPSKWYDVWPCIDAHGWLEKHKGIIIDSPVNILLESVWQSFLVTYFGCKSSYKNIFESWKYFVLFERNIRDQLLLAMKQADEKLLLIVKSLNISSTDSNSTYSLLNNCILQLFLEFPSDPIPCFDIPLDPQAMDEY